jgi:RNA polymerase sigma-70 factor (ECF subfamily)
VPPVAEVDPDGPLVRRAQDGDGEAFRSLVERHERRVFGLVLRVLHCDREFARDVSQEVFIRAYRGLAGFDPVARFTTWLHTIALNYCITEYRKKKALKRARRTLSIDAPLDGTDDLHIEPVARTPQPHDGVHHKDIAAAVRAAVAELPDEFQQAVLLRDLQGLSYEEIGDVLGIPPGTVRSRIHRGRLILQEKLKEFRP